MAKMETVIPNEKDLMDNLSRISYTFDKTYLSQLEDCYGVVPFDDIYKIDGNLEVTYSSNIRALRIKRCLIDKEERAIDCFKNVLSLFSGKEETVALIFKRNPNSAEMFIAVKNTGIGRGEESTVNINLLADSIRGNFPGTEVEILESRKIDDNSDDVTSTSKTLRLDNAKAVSILSNIPSEKSEDFVCQGIEKLLNGVVPQKEEESYTVVLMARAISMLEIRSMLSGYEELATALAPYTGYQFQIGTNESETTGEMQSLSHSEGISNSISKTHSVNVGLNVGKAISNTISSSIGIALPPLMIGIGLAKTVSSSFGLSGGYGYSRGKTETKSTQDTNTTGTNHGISLGSSESSTYTYKSYLASDLVDKLELTIKRIDESKANGLWKYAAYVLASNAKTTENVANFLRSISQGDESYVEPSFIQTWIYEKSNDITSFNEILKYVNHLCHPVFASVIDEKERDYLRIPVTPATDVDTNELANVFTFPRSSLPGLPVLECVRFGREPHSLDKLTEDLEIGCTYHMHQKERNKVYLSKSELAKHTFITGSTGAGKSNTVYKLLSEICLPKAEKRNDLKDKGRVIPTFLVIEPAKGEYKDAFGGRKDVTVYGTNPYKFPNLLQINPFSFPDDVQVLEHIDRLVEVFNACWPMYAAMPAILKEAIERSYESVGWYLQGSSNPGVFPTFDTLMEKLPKVIDSSSYSENTSSDYKGALITRVRSLTNGIQGLILNSDIDDNVKTSNEKLFDNNVIIDISRIGSSETKSLLMGILVLKLQEHRMSEATGSDKELQHITVLEEAHNLLRRTSSEQSQESSNLQGKSVEMLSNAIAEMRTFGEGFIIADQSPGLMDMSVIRNTNTKIIMRLPDEGDRLLVGKAAGLSDIQITELPKLGVGVAAISQSGWLEPILTYVGLFDEKEPMAKRYEEYRQRPVLFKWHDTKKEAVKDFFRLTLGSDAVEITREMVDVISKWQTKLGLGEDANKAIYKILTGNKISEEAKVVVLGEFLEINPKKIPVFFDKQEITDKVRQALIHRIGFQENDGILTHINDLYIKHYPFHLVKRIKIGEEVVR